MACPPGYPGWLAIFLTATPSSKGLALSSDFDFPKKWHEYGLSDLRECQ
jgi:hypothetical protein